MNLPKMISDLRAELADVERAIESLERLTAGPRKRGRPPKWRYRNGVPHVQSQPEKALAAGAGDSWLDNSSGSD